jgi:hypothetical protein
MPLLFIFSAKTEFEGKIVAPVRIALVFKNSFLSIFPLLFEPEAFHTGIYTLLCHKKQKSPLLRGACLNPISLGEGLYQQYHLFGLPAILRQSIILPNDIITSPIE